MAAALNTVLDLHGLGSTEAAGKTGKQRSAMSRWVKGESGLIRYDTVAVVETGLGLRLGTIGREAGYIEDPRTTLDAILAAPELTPDGRKFVADAFRVQLRIEENERQVDS